MEVILIPVDGFAYCSSILHVCGGDPQKLVCQQVQNKYSPRMWRWSSSNQVKSKQNIVFSTYVEVIPRRLYNNEFNSSILHVCGGDPNSCHVRQNGLKYSPRMWRWSYSALKIRPLFSVFSTYVEVILSTYEELVQKNGILHVCGGDS